MFDPLVELALAVLFAVGLPAMFVLFVLKGAIVGKPLPTSVLLPGYILATSPSTTTIVLAIAVASGGYVCGQLLIYLLAAQYGLETLQSNRWLSFTDAQIERVDELFERYSGPGVFVTNLLPYAGTFIVIPVGLAGYPIGRLAVYALTSTVLNYVLIVWFVVGSVGLLAG